MKLLTKQLKTFNSIAGGMKVNNILPITSYLKFEDGYITKNNMESFVTMEADFKGKCLIDEKILMSFVESINADTIDVKIGEKSVILSHGKEKVTSPTDDLINFPKNDESDIKEIEIEPEVMKAIKIASNFAIEREGVPFTSCVFIGNGIVSATSGFIAYVENSAKDLPEIIIEKAAASAIRNFDSVSFSENDTYQFYTNHIFKFGFIKKDTKFVNMKTWSALPQGLKSEVIDKNELIGFCDFCTKATVGRVAIASIVKNKLVMKDAAYEIDYEKPLSKELEDFTFNPVFMGKLLKSVPDETVTFSRAESKYYITGESGFVSLIMEMQP